VSGQHLARTQERLETDDVFTCAEIHHVAPTKVNKRLRGNAAHAKRWNSLQQLSLCDSNLVPLVLGEQTRVAQDRVSPGQTCFEVLRRLSVTDLGSLGRRQQTLVAQDRVSPGQAPSEVLRPFRRCLRPRHAACQQHRHDPDHGPS